MAEYFKTAEVAGMLRTTPRTVNRLVVAGELEASRLGKSRIFRPEAVEAFVRRREAQEAQRAGA